MSYLLWYQLRHHDRKTHLRRGQTGADRAALDVSILHGFAHGGRCPKGRLALDGVLGGQYQLSETPSAGYLQRTEWNMRNTDSTVVFTFAATATGGALKTLAFAREQGKPCLHLPLRQVQNYEDPALQLQCFMELLRVHALNVAGSRGAKEPGLYLAVSQELNDAFSGARPTRA
jgi:hypothetical protein